MIKRGDSWSHWECVKEHLLVSLSQVEVALDWSSLVHALYLKVLDILGDAGHDILGLLHELVVGWLEIPLLTQVLSALLHLLRHLHLREVLNWELRHEHWRLSHLHHLTALTWECSVVDLSVHESVARCHDWMASMIVILVPFDFIMQTLVNHLILNQMGVLRLRRRGFGGLRKLYRGQVWILCFSDHISKLVEGLNQSNDRWPQILTFWICLDLLFSSNQSPLILMTSNNKRVHFGHLDNILDSPDDILGVSSNRSGRIVSERVVNDDIDRL